MLNRKAEDVEIVLFSSTNTAELEKQFEEWKNTLEYNEGEILDIQYQESSNGYSMMIIYKW